MNLYEIYIAAKENGFEAGTQLRLTGNVDKPNRKVEGTVIRQGEIAKDETLAINVQSHMRLQREQQEKIWFAASNLSTARPTNQVSPLKVFC